MEVSICSGSEGSEQTGTSSVRGSRGKKGVRHAGMRGRKVLVVVGVEEVVEGRKSAQRRTNLLQDGDGEGGGLSSSGLGLGDDIVSLNDGDDGSLLDSGRSLETVGVNSSEKLGLELHVVEAVEGETRRQGKKRGA